MDTVILQNIVIFVGPPGSGKGSLSSLCLKKLGWAQLSTGNLCRRHIANCTEIGHKIDFAIKSGKMISDDLITDMVKPWLLEVLKQEKAVILDGYPRTAIQAESLDTILSQPEFEQVQFDIVRLVLSDELVIDRLASRYICQNKDCQAVYSLTEGAQLAPRQAGHCDACSSPIERRDDDVLEAVQERLRMYHYHEDLLLNFYRAIGKTIHDIDANQPLDQVFEDFKRVVGLR